MSSYIVMEISGNKDFGGYISIDGEKSVPIVNDDFIRITPGQHSLKIHSTSDAERKLGKTQAFIYNNTSSSGAIFDSIERNNVEKSLGDTWNINVYVGDSQAVCLRVVTKGQQIVDTPLYKVEDLPEELEKEMDEAHEEWVNTPVRSPKLMLWGFVLTFCGVIGGYTYLAAGGIASDGIGGLFVMIGMVLLGGLLFYNGFKKKIRRQ